MDVQVPKTIKTLLGLMKDLNKWRHKLWPWSKRPNIVKMSILQKLIYRFNTIPIKVTAGFFLVEIDKLPLKLRNAEDLE